MSDELKPKSIWGFFLSIKSILLFLLKSIWGFFLRMKSILLFLLKSIWGFFLRMKSILLFLLIFIIPLAITTSTFFVPGNWIYGAYMPFAVSAIILTTEVVLYLWMWALGNAYYKASPVREKFSNKAFRLFVWIPLLVTVLFIAFWVYGASTISTGKLSAATMLSSTLLFAIPLQLVFMIGKFYCFYFAAKLIKSAETGTEARFEDFTKEFILLLFFPIGLWFIQPRINKLYRQLTIR
jgi:hypothetical protein